MQTTELGNELRSGHDRFMKVMAGLRPQLHRYCTYMTGSSLDGEDLVQEALAQAFYSLPQLHQDRPVEPWLFRIAHNKCIDFFRKRREHPVDVIEEEDGADSAEAILLNKEALLAALRILVHQLPPMERACLILREVFGYSMVEMAGIVDSTEGGVKTALYRGRKKVARLSEAESSNPAPLDPDQASLLEQYVQLFNQQDWDAVREFIRADARLEIVGMAQAEGRRFIEQNYFTTYAGKPIPWRFSVAQIDGDWVLLCAQQRDGVWTPATAARLVWDDGKISAIRDYVRVPYLLQVAELHPHS